MERVVEALETCLKHQHIDFEPTEYSGVFRTSFVGENGRFPGYVAADEEERTVQFQTFAPVRVTPSKRRDIAELLTRINYCLLISVFELNMDSGAIACRTSIVLGESDLQYDVMEHLLHLSWSMMDWFLPAINAVLFANVPPEQAIDGMTRRPQPDTPDEKRSGESHGSGLRDFMGGSMN